VKLIIKRNQKEKKDVFGAYKGVTFILNCRIELDSVEQELVSKYNASDQVLTYKESQDSPDLTLNQLINGVTAELDDIGVMMNKEEVIKKACESFKNRLMIMATFGGEEVIDI